MATENQSLKLVWWIMGGLLALSFTAGGWWARDLQQRLDLLSQTSTVRNERVVEVATKVSGMEPRMTNVEGKLSTIEPRVPLLESRISGLESRLDRIDSKLDRLLDRGK